MTVWRHWLRPPAATGQLPPVEQLVRETPELSRLFVQFGHAHDSQPAVRALLDRMRSAIRAEVTDFEAFRQAVQAAQARPESGRLRYDVRNRQLLDDVSRAGDDRQAVLAALNRDPVHDQVPFVEQVPVMKGGELTWLTPVEHSSIRKRPEDPAQFESLLDELEAHFRDPHPARRDEFRQQVLEAVARLRRELKRERAYLPTAIQFLESRIQAYEDHSLDPSAKAAMETLTALLGEVRKVREQCASGALLSETEREQLARTAAAQAGRYLNERRFWTPWLANHLLDTLLDPALFSITRWPRRRLRAVLKLIREEVASGHYDAEEISGRIRRLEAQGVYVRSYVYALLATQAAPPRKIEARTHRGPK